MYLMKNRQRQSLTRCLATGLLATGVLAGLTACGPSGTGTNGGGNRADKTVISVQGSDTMVNEAQAWAEAYAKVQPEVSVEVGGGGSGVGIAALIAGTIDIANASREMKASELAKAKANSGVEPVEFIVGYDALAVYVHRDNPLEEITLEQLAGIYVEGGALTKWSDLGITVPGCDGEILRVSRQSNSGTYEFFREHVLDKHDFRLGSTDLNGSKEVVEMVGSTPCAIGYSGMGYATDKVKMLKVAIAAGEPAYPPSIETALSKQYPIARPLYLYTLGQPEGPVKQYIDWIRGPEGQKIVAESGYVPLPQPSAP